MACLKNGKRTCEKVAKIAAESRDLCEKRTQLCVQIEKDLKKAKALKIDTEEKLEKNLKTVKDNDGYGQIACGVIKEDCLNPKKKPLCQKIQALELCASIENRNNPMGVKALMQNLAYYKRKSLVVLRSMVKSLTNCRNKRKTTCATAQKASKDQKQCNELLEKCNVFDIDSVDGGTGF